MIADINTLEPVCKEIKKRLPGGGVVLLKGDLASGKTTLVKAFAKFMNIDEEVSSPTFSIMQQYADKIYHYDIYNEGVQKFIESGLIENLESSGYHFIEWADEKLEEILKDFGFNYITIEILPINEAREYRFES
ncbi:MAG: tRNA (adenosine(37)-N6)-threonylcarbamoyltransferase complex ATPase subunit type 1 TsaE [Sulfurospirillum sp.]|nr:MAG: tRNA (adenosine(37)-N6)-threonylcarbamoyltransferase complex ATPase subunit type 1 TsaE [Sulfurospirillum sp.]